MRHYRVLLSVFVLLFSATLFAAEPVNINTADASQLATAIKGIGPAKATAIVVYRKANGLFKSLDELAKVKGIGVKTVNKNRENLTIGLKTNEEKKTK